MIQTVRRLFIPCAVCLFAVIACAARGQAAAATNVALLDVGVAQIDITPQMPIRLQGFPRGERAEEITAIAQPILAKAIAIGSDEQGPRILVVADIIGVSEKLSEELYQRLAKKVDLKDRARLCFCAMHNHSAPTVESVIPFIFKSSPTQQQSEHIHQYTRWLMDQLEQVAIDALAARRPSILNFARGSVDLAVNRRMIKDGKWSGFGVNTDGPVDHDLFMLTVENPDGHLRAVMANYACHGVCWQEPSVHDGWMGVAMRQVQAKHPGATAIVTIGCAGDQNTPQIKSDQIDGYGKLVGDEMERLIDSPKRPIRALPVAQFKRLTLDYATPPNKQDWSKRRDWYAQSVRAELAAGHSIPSTMPYVVQTWAFGKDLAMVFLAGEPVVEYSLRLKRELDGRRLWVTGYANAQPGYIASRKMLPEGGYEVEQSMRIYGRPGPLAANTEDRIIHVVHQLLGDAFDSPDTPTQPH